MRILFFMYRFFPNKIKATAHIGNMQIISFQLVDKLH